MSTRDRFWTFRVSWALRPRRAIAWTKLTEDTTRFLFS